MTRDDIFKPVIIESKFLAPDQFFLIDKRIQDVFVRCFNCDGEGRCPCPFRHPSGHCPHCNGMGFRVKPVSL